MQLILNSVQYGKSNPFIHILFQQLLPSLKTHSSLILSGQSKRLSYAQDFCALMHLLSPQSTMNEATIKYPKLNQEELARIRRHTGSLLFFGMKCFVYSCDRSLQHASPGQTH